MLDVESIIAEAEAKAEFCDSEPNLHGNLAALLASLPRDGELDADGLASARRNLVARTADRLEGLKWVERHPEILEEPIEAPVFLTGLPRSGTTFFQYLFDRDSRFRQIRTWEALMPSPPPAADPASVERRRAIERDVRRQMRAREVEGFDALHLLDEDGSEECHAFLEQSYAAAGFFNLYDVPGYFDALMSEIDLAAAYRVHKRQLQLLQWRAPRRRWSLKYPNHLIAMDAIVAVHPDALFAMTHRDPVQTLASIAKMTLKLRQSRYADVDPHRVGAQMRDFVRRHVDRIMAFSTSGDPAKVIHVDYYALVADPLATMRDVHARMGIDTPAEVANAVASWQRENPKNARGANPYTLEQFGLDADAMVELFSDYTRHFAIPRESGTR